MMTKNTFYCVAAGLALMLLPASVAAKPRKAQHATTQVSKASAASTTPKKVSHARPAMQDTDDGYIYKFDDDPLSGNSAAANAATITVRQRGARRTLIRPRLHFVPELLKSVEYL